MASVCASLAIVLWDFDVGDFSSRRCTDFMSIQNVACSRLVPIAHIKSIFDVRQASARDATRGYWNATTQVCREASFVPKAMLDCAINEATLL